MAEKIKFEVIQLAVGGFDKNFSYLLVRNGRAALVDPTGDLRKIEDARRGFELDFILLTHRHPDHTANLNHFPGTPVFEFANLTDGEKIPLGGDGEIKAIFTPGHSRDSVCYLAGDALFTGDTLFVDYIGFGKAEQLFNSLKRLKKLPDATTVWPGHDYGHAPHSTIGAEKAGNIYFRAAGLDEFKAVFARLD
ncbi:MAG: hydroxyacylglutathione hydrolase family protein [Victivallaceae bacterium]|nr:hydroxyacylglutathione hydrolase family protein [Victivallaceae bacterium]